MQSYFISATGTDMGKTLLMTTLCWQLKQAGKKVTALKPIISGYDPQDETNDTSLILKSCGIMPTPALAQAISPWRFRFPLSPDMAAAKEGAKLPSFDMVVNYCREHETLASDVLLVEGVGGIMVPINDTHTVLDVTQALGWPVILACGTYLGSISHTLSALEILRTRGLSVRALAVNETERSTVSLDDTAATLQKFVSHDTSIIKLPRQAKDEPWKHMPLISWMVS